jgi:vancomycin resistance protein VanJ
MSVSSPWSRGTQPMPRTRPPENQERVRRRFARWTIFMSIANVFFSVGIVILLLEASENWWFTGALIYVPQTPFLIPSICLLACSCIWHLRSAWLNVTSMGLLLFTVCGFHFSMKPFNPPVTSKDDVTVLSCNVQNFQPHFGEVLREVARSKPDIVVFQEAREVPEMLTDYLEDWHWQHSGQFLVGSKWPIELLGEFDASPYQRTSAIKVRVKTPLGPIIVGDVHLQTARRGLTDLSLGSIVDGDGPASVEHHAFLRDEEALQTRAFLSGNPAGTPFVIAGDFNMPETSSIYDTHFGDLRDVFAEAGLGFGYTVPSRAILAASCPVVADRSCAGQRQLGNT